MGIYDRDYYRDRQPGLRLRAPRSVTATLVIINVAIYLVDYLLLGPDGRIARSLSAQVGTLTRPLFWWQFLTYGFVHDYAPAHVVFNMLTLWIFGRPIEERYGAKEFLRLYLVLLVFGSVVWALAAKFIEGAPPEASVIGASGAVTGIVILFVLNYPHVQVALFFVLPMPAWVLGVILVAQDVYGAMHRGAESGNRVAFTVHLAGAAFALVYYQSRWNLGRLGPGRVAWRWLARRPRLRIHTPDDEDKQFNEEVDRILTKISHQGEASLSAKERRTLKNASRRFQQRRHDADDPDQ